MVDTLIDKRDMKDYLSEYYLDYRSILNFDGIYTFGTEIEHETMKKELAKKATIDLGWQYAYDISLTNGGESISPILTNNYETWEEIKLICNELNKCSLIDEKTGGHIHVGMHILGNNPLYWKNFLLLWSTYENIIYRFLYGEYVTYRSGVKNYARPSADYILDTIKKIKYNADTHNIIVNLNDLYSRMFGINFFNLIEVSPSEYEKVANKNTIEIRCPNGTLNPIIWQNNINFIMHLFLYAKSPKFDKDIICKRLRELKKSNIISELNAYDLIYYDQALELANLIFNNDLDKLYFLRQYFKDFEVAKEPFQKSKTFTLY